MRSESARAEGSDRGSRHVLLSAGPRGDRVIGLHLADAFCHRLRGQLFEDFLADRIIDFGERGEIEINAQQFDQPRSLFGLQRLDKVAHVGLVQAADQRTQMRCVASFDHARDTFDKGLADRAVLVARQLRSLGLAVFFFLIEHSEPAVDKVRAACTPAINREQMLRGRNCDRAMGLP